MVSIFIDRLKSLSEQGRFEVLEAHLMSVEDLDIYNNVSLSQILDENTEELGRLSDVVEKDPRFAGWA